MAAKRRHSRPLKLDSEGEEEVDTSEKEESLSDREEEPDETATERLSSVKVSHLNKTQVVVCCVLGVRSYELSDHLLGERR